MLHRQVWAPGRGEVSNVPSLFLLCARGGLPSRVTTRSGARRALWQPPCAKSQRRNRSKETMRLPSCTRVIIGPAHERPTPHPHQPCIAAPCARTHGPPANRPAQPRLSAQGSGPTAAAVASLAPGAQQRHSQLAAASACELTNSSVWMRNQAQRKRAQSGHWSPSLHTYIHHHPAPSSSPPTHILCRAISRHFRNKN